MRRAARFAQLFALLALAPQLSGCFYAHGRHGRLVVGPPAVQLRISAPALVVPPPPAYLPPPPPPAVMVAPPVVMAPPVVVAPPVVEAPVAAAPVVAAPPVVVAPAPPPPPEPERPALLAVKYAPGASATVAINPGVELGGWGFTHSLGVEVRLARWLALRSDYELRQEGRSWDLVGVKVWPFPGWVLKPYLSASLSGSEAWSDPGKYQLGMMAALGLDLFIGRHFFIEAEARYRVTPTDCCRQVPHLSALAGVGVAFF